MHAHQKVTPLVPAGADTDRGKPTGQFPLPPPAGRVSLNPATRIARAGALLVSLLITAIPVIAASGPAHASANKCSGGLHRSCVDVKGKHRHVDRIRSQIIPAGESCIYGHSQVMIGGRHYADSNLGRDDHYCGTGYPGKKITTWTWYVKRSYAKGTKICAKFWQKIDGRYRERGNACATVG